MAFRVVPNAASGLTVLPLILICLPHSDAPVSAQEVRASVSSRTAYQGESFIYQLRVAGVEEPVPEIPDLASARFEPLGPPAMQQNITIINGRTTQTSSLTFSWRVTPLASGELTIPSVSVKTGDKVLQSQPVRVNVVAPSESNLFSLSAHIDRERIYPRQPFSVEFNIEMRRLPEPFSDVSPVSSQVLRSPPQLRVPWLEDSRLPDGLAPTRPLDTRPWHTADGTGFTVNGMRRFGFITMLPEEEPIDNTQIRYTFKRQFVAERPGRFELGAASLRGTLVDTIQDGRATVEDVFGVTEVLTINVEPLPLDSRPDSWIGVIGDLDVRSQITPKEGQVGQPMTLTLTLKGNGALADAFPPKLSANDEVTRQFRIYEPTSQLTQSGRIFKYSVRPKQAGSINFPSIELTWFDPVREKYVTGRTSEIPLQIALGSAIAGNDIQSSGSSTEPEVMMATATGITANLIHFTDDRIHPKNWFIAWGAMAGITLVLCLVTGRKSSRATRLAKVRNERLESAKSQMANAVSLLQSSERDAGITGIRTAINQIAAAVVNSEDEGMTTAEVCTQLHSAGVDSELIETTKKLLEDCDATQYAGASDRVEGLKDAATRTIGDLLHTVQRIRFDA